MGASQTKCQLVVHSANNAMGIAVSTSFNSEHPGPWILAGTEPFGTWIYRMGSHGGHGSIDDYKWVESGAADAVKATYGNPDLCGASFETIRALMAASDGPTSSSWPD